MATALLPCGYSPEFAPIAIDWFDADCGPQIGRFFIFAVFEISKFSPVAPLNEKLVVDNVGTVKSFIFAVLISAFCAEKLSAYRVCPLADVNEMLFVEFNVEMVAFVEFNCCIVALVVVKEEKFADEDEIRGLFNVKFEAVKLFETDRL